MKKKNPLPKAPSIRSTAALTAIALATVGVNVSPRAYSSEGELVAMPPAPELALHEYRPSNDGRLEHWIDGRLRATVPPEGLEEYARTWPDCAGLARTLKAADR